MPPDVTGPAGPDGASTTVDRAASLIDPDGSAAASGPVGPYATAAVAYFEHGWRGVLPLPPKSKRLAVVGYTGHEGVDPSGPDVYTWVDDQPDGNVALRLPENVIGIDVDAYKASGADTFGKWEAEYGTLPPTWRCTARSDGVSGIRFFRVPTGLAWLGQLSGGGVEIIHRGHRYAMAPPSIHPDLGVPVRWYDPAGVLTESIPKPDELPELPQAWVAALSVGADHHAQKTGLTGRQAHQRLIEMPRAGEDPCERMRGLADEAIAAIGSAGRHDSIRGRVLDMVRWAEKDRHPGLIKALVPVRESFVSSVVADKTRTEAQALAEWGRIVNGAIDIVTTDPTFPIGFVVQAGCPCEIASRNGSAAGTVTAGRRPTRMKSSGTPGLNWVSSGTGHWRGSATPGRCWAVRWRG